MGTGWHSPCVEDVQRGYPKNTRHASFASDILESGITFTKDWILCTQGVLMFVLVIFWRSLEGTELDGRLGI